MRVLHVSGGRAWRGGEQQVLDLMRGLAARGTEQVLLARREGALVARVRAEGLPAVPIPFRNEADARALGRVVSTIRRFRPDVLHLHTSQAHGIGAVAARLAGRRRPAVVVTRRVEYSIFRHSFLGLDRLKYDPGADLVLCVSERIRDVLLADGLVPSRLAVVPDGVDVARLAPPPGRRGEVRRALDLAPEAPVVGHVASLERAKGQDVLLEAFVRVREVFPSARLLLVGEGRDGEALRRRAAALGLADSVRFLGVRRDVPALLAAMDVFAFPSRAEGLGTSVLEAMAAGVPVVASEVGGIPEALAGGEAGRLVPAGDAAALAGAIVDLIAHAPEARDLAARARGRVTERFSASRMVEATLDAYARAAPRHSSRIARTRASSTAGANGLRR